MRPGTAWACLLLHQFLGPLALPMLRTQRPSPSPGVKLSQLGLSIRHICPAWSQVTYPALGLSERPSPTPNPLWIMSPCVLQSINPRDCPLQNTSRRRAEVQACPLLNPGAWDSVRHRVGSRNGDPLRARDGPSPNPLRKPRPPAGYSPRARPLTFAFAGQSNPVGVLGSGLPGAQLRGRQ